MKPVSNPTVAFQKISPSPKPGGSLLSAIQNLARPLHTAHRLLVAELRREGESILSIRNDLHRDSLPAWKPHATFEALGASLILNWLSARRSSALKPYASLWEAESWFTGIEDYTSLLHVNPAVDRSVVKILEQLNEVQCSGSMISFAAEVFETDNEILVERGGGRQKKRARGIYYTPSDVSNFIISKVYCDVSKLAGKHHEGTWIDPSCGTGSILINVFEFLMQNGQMRPEERLKQAKQIYGIDISAIATQTCAYLILLEVIKESDKSTNIAPVNLLSDIAQNFFVSDAIRFENATLLASVFPERATGFTFLVSNPPYVSSRVSTDKSRKAQSIVPRFLGLMGTLLDPERGAGGMVVPLSLTYSSRKEYQDFRKTMWQKGAWSIYNFDRTPDSLFGDDVKTRNSVVFFARDPNQSVVRTSDLVRWNSRNRSRLFANLNTASIDTIFRNQHVPKCGSDFGQSLLCQIYGGSHGVLGDWIKRCSYSELSAGRRGLAIGTTAYNWFPSEIRSGPVEEVKSSNRYHFWLPKEAIDPFAIFALTQCRIAYWLWRVWGDGFHLTDSFISGLPLVSNSFSSESWSELSRLGLHLWDRIKNKPIKSKNSGITNITYCPYFAEELIDEIDKLVVSNLELPHYTIEYLKSFIFETVTAGRKNGGANDYSLRNWFEKENFG